MNFQKLYDDAILPTRATHRSAGYDLHAYDSLLIPPNQTRLVKVGVSARLGIRDVLQVCSRSGLALNQNVFVLNAPGIVDADYFPNEIGVILHNASEKTFEVNKGDRIAQAVVTEYKITHDDEPREFERVGGFGSTGMGR
jgi:dUTP pyrophosphatase